MSRRHYFLLIVICCLLSCPADAPAQTANPAGARRATPANAKQGEEELGPPETVSITTKDNVVLKCTYYPGEKSKTTVPLILLHDWKSNRNDLHAMAEYLQKTHKYAVIVPDMRGHGESLRVQGSDKSIDINKFKKVDVADMVNDIERCKKFLMQKNNLGELNIEMLTLVSVGQMSVEAVRWCIGDWMWEPIGGRKQGKDVKALLMISPERKIKGVSMSQELKSNLFTGKGGQPLAVYLTWAENDEIATREGNAIVNALAKSRSKLDESRLKVRAPYTRTDLDGTGLVRDPKHKVVFQDVARFVENTLVANKELLPWQNRAKQ